MRSANSTWKAVRGLGALLSSVVVTAVAIAPPTATAAGYDVHACDPAYGNANRAWAGVADSGMTAYDACAQSKGLTVRSIYDNGASGFLQGAYYIFDTPPGTSLGAIAFEAGFERASCSWGLGVAQSNGDLGGNYVWGLPAYQTCDSYQTPGETSFFPYRFSSGLSGSRVRLEARCGAGSCPRSGTNALRIRNLTLHVNDDIAPTLTNGRGGLWANAGWLSGTQTAGFDAADGSGISQLAIRVDGKEVAHRTNGCDYTQRAPCPGGGMDQELSTAGFSDGKHALTLSGVDAAGNEGTVSRDVLIDNTAPASPQQLTLSGGDGWRSANDFSLDWTLPQEDGAPIAGAEWDLCPATGACVHGSKAGDAIHSLQSLQVPSAGEWTMRLWLRDAAGNQDNRLASSPVKLRFDNVSPELAFQPLSADDPTLVTVHTSDQGSGVTSGAIDVRKVGSAGWKPLATTIDGDKLTARIDDEHLAKGQYEMRALATDQAGNQRTTTTGADGAPAHFALPLRLPTRLRAGIVRRHGRRAKLARAAYVHYGTLVRVSGRLTTPEGNPMQGVDVQAVTQIRDGVTPQRLLATVKTSRTGRFSFLVRRGPSRTIDVRYGGTAQIRPSARQLTLNVRAATSLRPNRRDVVNGEDVRFHGRVRTGRIPEKGKLVEMQVFVRGKWRTFVTTRASRRGTWQYDYRFDGTRGSQHYRFRAKLPPEAGYPFAAGLSRVVGVHVRGA